MQPLSFGLSLHPAFIEGVGVDRGEMDHVIRLGIVIAKQNMNHETMWQSRLYTNAHRRRNRFKHFREYLRDNCDSVTEIPIMMAKIRSTWRRDGGPLGGDVTATAQT